MKKLIKIIGDDLVLISELTLCAVIAVDINAAIGIFFALVCVKIRIAEHRNEKLLDLYLQSLGLISQINRDIEMLILRKNDKNNLDS